jgi:transposase
VCSSDLNRGDQELTVVIDKGLNSVGNFAWIDAHRRMHFVTSYAPYFAQHLAAMSMEEFEPVDTAKNRLLLNQGKAEEQLLAYRTTGEYWGKERTVVVTYNPVTARKQAYAMESKLETLQQELLAMCAKVEEKAPYWRNPDSIRERYLRLCEHLHTPSDLYSLKFSRDAGALSMSFKREDAQIEQKYALFGKNIIITDHMDWTTVEIVQASLDRWQVEDRFRLSKDDDLVAMRPLRHWTDSKIRCHLFACVVAMTYLRRIELKLNAAGIRRTAQDVMEDMRHFHSVLLLKAHPQKPIRQLEIPTISQAELLSAFKHYVDDGGVLHPIAP